MNITDAPRLGASVFCGAARRTHATICFGGVSVSSVRRESLLYLKSNGGDGGAGFQGEEGKDCGFGTVGDVGDGRGDGDVGHDVVTCDAVLEYGQYRETPVVGVGSGGGVRA